MKTLLRLSLILLVLVCAVNAMADDCGCNTRENTNTTSSQDAG